MTGELKMVQRTCTLRRSSGESHRGLTLVEVVVSTMIVGLMTVASLHTLGAATRSSLTTGDRAVALGLADDLMAEILSAPYDDLDDYHNYNEALAGDHAGWIRRATVQRVKPADVTQATPGNADQGAKRIRVYITLNSQQLAEQFAIRTSDDE
jgi:prepilin-type N-terminal cleavage/methylation domain-containing protein